MLNIEEIMKTWGNRLGDVDSGMLTEAFQTMPPSFVLDMSKIVASGSFRKIGGKYSVNATSFVVASQNMEWILNHLQSSHVDVSLIANYAVRTHNVDLLRLAYKKNPRMDHWGFPFKGHTIVHYAAEVGSLECLKELLKPQYGTWFLTALTVKNENVAHIAGRKQQKECLVYLLSIYPGFLTQKNVNDNTVQFVTSRKTFEFVKNELKKFWQAQITKGENVEIAQEGLRLIGESNPVPTNNEKKRKANSTSSVSIAAVPSEQNNSAKKRDTHALIEDANQIANYQIKIEKAEQGIEKLRAENKTLSNTVSILEKTNHQLAQQQLVAPAVKVPDPSSASLIARFAKSGVADANRFVFAESQLASSPSNSPTGGNI